LIGRLHYKRDFNNLRVNGKTVKRGFLSVVFSPSDNFSDGIRVAFAVGRSVGGAVVRNRIKRRLREAFAKMITKNKLVPNGDYLIRVFPGVNNKSFTFLTENLENIIEDLRKDND
jgi:ribonuclease P protein component|tara:strand:+ start:451 stop:795 length:345 start_codon:yes stop_codon:yes gene_type:complete